MLVALDIGEQVLRVVRELGQIRRHVLAGTPRPFDQLGGETRQPRRAGDQARLLLDLAGIEIVFGAGPAPPRPLASGWGANRAARGPLAIGRACFSMLPGSRSYSARGPRQPPHSASPV